METKSTLETPCSNRRSHSVSWLDEIASKSTIRTIWWDGDETSGSLSGNYYTFTGRRSDPESDLMYFRNRYYSPELGRFVTRDPSGFADGPNLYIAGFVPGLLDSFGLKIEDKGCREFRLKKWNLIPGAGIGQTYNYASKDDRQFKASPKYWAVETKCRCIRDRDKPRSKGVWKIKTTVTGWIESFVLGPYRKGSPEGRKWESWAAFFENRAGEGGYASYLTVKKIEKHWRSLYVGIGDQVEGKYTDEKAYESKPKCEADLKVTKAKAWLDVQSGFLKVKAKDDAYDKWLSSGEGDNPLEDILEPDKPERPERPGRL
jgi:RHS repeat-associated protein